MAEKISAPGANDKLIKNLETQLERLVEQLKDLEDCKCELAEDEYQSMKDETMEQIKEFTVTLDRMNKGDITLINKFSSMRAAIRKAISNSFDTVEMIRLFGDHSSNALVRQLEMLEKDFQLKKIPLENFELQKVQILLQLKDQGYSLSDEYKVFLENKSNSEMIQGLERIDENIG